MNNLDRDIVEQVIGNILMLNIDITDVKQLNITHYQIELFGRDGQALISADDLAASLSNLSPEQNLLLLQIGVNIADVISNAPLPTPTTRVPVRPIPPWAVGVIVVLNSVIIVALLLIVLGIIWRRYRR